jgi:hypothetical protein
MNSETKRAMTGSGSSFSGRIDAGRTGWVFTLTTSQLVADFCCKSHLEAIAES